MVEFDELLITTGVDSLVRLVREKGRVELTEAAGVLNIPESTIEEWGGVLEEEGIIRIEYRLTRIFLVWVTPTEEEAAAEKAEITRKKKAVEEEVGELKQKIKPESEDLAEFRKSFSDAYAKLSPRLAELEKKLEGVSRTKAGGSAKLGDYAAKVDDVSSRLDSINKELVAAKGEMAEIGKKVEKGPTKKSIEKLESLAGGLESMKKDLAALRLRAERYAKGRPEEGEMPGMEEIKGKLDELMKEFHDLKERSAKMREDLSGLQEGKDVLKVIGESMKDYDRKIAGMRKGVTELSAQANELREKSGTLATKLEKDRETIEHFSDSMKVAREILDRFPAQKGLTQELDKISKAEKSIDERTRALKKLVEVAGGAETMAVEYEELSEKMTERMDQLSAELDDLSSALAEEKETFLTYESIREKVLPSLERSRREMESTGKELERMKSEVGSVTKELEAEATKVSSSMDKEKVRDVMKVAEEVERRREALENIRGTIDSLAQASDNLNKRLAVLSRQAGMFEIRTGGAAVAGEAPKESEIREQIALTRNEEEEFKKKREELRSLIKKLWEDENKK